MFKAIPKPFPPTSSLSVCFYQFKPGDRFWSVILTDTLLVIASWIAVWFVLLLFYAIATVFHLYLVGDMMHEMRRRKPGPTLSLTHRTFNLPHYIGMA